MIGQHVVQESLRSGHDVIAISRNPAVSSAPAQGRLQQAKADLADRHSVQAALSGADAVIHCAGYYPGPPRPLPEEIAITTKLADNFYEACAELPLRKIVYVGAAIAFPRKKDCTPSDGQESYRGAPPDKNSYVQVKWLQDDLALRQARRGLPVVVGIPSMTFGEFDPGNSTGRFILEMANRTLPGYVAGNRNIVYAGDAARGLIRAAEQGVPGRRYLFTGENLTMRELMAKIAVITSSPEPKAIPLRVAKALSVWQSFRYRYGNGPLPKISASAIAVMSSGQFLDGALAKQELGYVPRVSADEAIRRTFAWFSAQGMILAR